MDSTGTLRNLWIKPAMGAAMEAVDSMSVVAGEGIVGNADRGGDRQVTILATERWADVEADLGRSVEPSTRRANLFVEGVELADSSGRVLRVGGCFPERESLGGPLP